MFCLNFLSNYHTNATTTRSCPIRCRSNIHMYWNMYIDLVSVRCHVQTSQASDKSTNIHAHAHTRPFDIGKKELVAPLPIGYTDNNKMSCGCSRLSADYLVNEINISFSICARCAYHNWTRHRIVSGMICFDRLLCNNVTCRGLYE